MSGFPPGSMKIADMARILDKDQRWLHHLLQYHAKRYCILVENVLTNAQKQVAHAGTVARLQQIERLASEAEAATDTVLEIMKDTDQPGMPRLKAAEMVYEPLGISGNKQVTHIHRMSESTMRALSGRLDTLGIRPKPPELQAESVEVVKEEDDIEPGQLYDEEDYHPRPTRNFFAGG